MASAAERDAMRRALELAATPGVPRGPNPRVGAVLLAQDGSVISEGYHRGAGTAHAEVDALTRAAGRSRGATAVITLEPCNHLGRTGPCSVALWEAGVARVVFAQPDISRVAQGGAQFLESKGVSVEGGVYATEAEALNGRWSAAHKMQRPWITYKFAATLDGRVAAPDGSSQWITGETARTDVHALRAQVDAVMVGTGTVLADDPSLTARLGQVQEHQPKRVIVGSRELPAGSNVLDDRAETVQLRSHDPADVARTLYDQDVQWVLLEGGPTLAGAFIAAGVVDEIVAYLAPALLGAGQSVVSVPGVTSIADIARMELSAVEQIDADIKVTALMNGGADGVHRDS